MWGLISTESSYNTNFNTGFSTTRSDVLIHLAQWQYWWWFWFSFLWSLYYLVFLKVFRFRNLKMRPKISTSFRPHGKWGDFLAAIIPAIWCLNILTNSNFILRLVEWQAESSLFTVRVRGRQWYWVYKYELKAIMEVLTTPKNIGSSKWIINFFGDLSIEESYLQALKIRRNNQWVKDFWTKLTQKLETVSNEVSYFYNPIRKELNTAKIDNFQKKKIYLLGRNKIVEKQLDSTYYKYNNISEKKFFDFKNKFFFY